MKLIKIDPANPPQYKKQMLFYNEKWKMFRLGSVDHIRTDEFGTRTVYKQLEPLKVIDGSRRELIVNFEPTHYLDFELSDLAKTIENESVT